MVCDWFTFAQECDIPNWMTLVVEILIGSLLAGILFTKQKRQSDKLQKVIDEQEKSRKAREKWTYLGLINKMEFLKMALYERKKLENSILENKLPDQEQQHINARLINTLIDLEQTRKENSGNIQVELMPLIENIITYAKVLSENRRWHKMDFEIFEETRNVINELLGQLNAVHPQTVIQPYQNNPDWK